MINTKDITFRDYSGMVRRHKSLLVWTALACLVAGIGIAKKLPKRFTSRSVIAVEPQKLPGSTEYSSPAELNHRILILQEQIYSRRLLEGVAERVFVNGIDDKLGSANIVEQLQHAVTLVPLKGEFSSREDGLPVFSINVSYSDPAIAQRLCAEITSVAIAGNLRERENKALSTTAFIDEQLADAERTVQAKNRALMGFKSRYSGILPSEEQGNIALIATFTAEEETASTGLAHAQQEKTYAESMLAQKVTAWRASSSGTSNESLQEQLTKLQSELVMLEARHTDRHPEVIRTRAQIAALQKQLRRTIPLADTSGGPPQPIIEPAEIQHLRAQVNALDETIEIKQQELVRVQRRLATYRSRVQLRPFLDDQYKALTRDYDTAVALYNDLEKKKAQADMTVNLAKQPEKDFRIIDEANYPDTSEFPRVSLFAAGGLFLGLLAGFALVFLIEALDQALRTEQDVVTYLELPTLASIPDLATIDRA